MVAQEESHKKSEAMLASYQQRFQQGNYMKPDLLGFDRVGVNEIAVNVDEARTVQLIFMMFLAGIRPNMIADVLMMLGRKTHTGKLRDGRIKEGAPKWTTGSVMSVLQNERRCGDVLAQKTYTPNYLNHKSKKNENALPRYYAVDQHPAIVAPDDFMLTQKIIRANRGGWSQGLPQMDVYRSGMLSGFVSAIPSWRGFDAEDYNRAALRAYGVEEEQLQETERRIAARKREKSEAVVPAADFQHRYAIDSDDYVLFPDRDIEQQAVIAEELRESFKALAKTARDQKAREIHREDYGRYDLAGCEIARPQYFDVREKVRFTLDSRGIIFGKYCLKKLSAGGGSVDRVEMAYNPLEKLLVLCPASGQSERTLRWTTDRKGVVHMRRCGCRGIAGAIFTNMGWNEDYKVLVLGELVRSANESMLVFDLDDPIMIVPAKPGVVKDIDTDGIDKNWARKIVREGSLPEQSFIPDLSDFDLSDGPMASSVRRMSRSRAIYYDDLTEKAHGELRLSDLGDQKYDPECIRRLIQKGIKPVEGWGYLKGMAVIRERDFSIYPESWADSFGEELYGANCRMLRTRLKRVDREIAGDVIPYGWTVGLDLPTRETVKEAIDFLKSESA